jgi:choline dehydrogenase-like flavoprotein
VSSLHQPLTGGSIALASSDPLDHPIINPNFLTADIDIAILREAVKSARSFMSASAWSNWITGEFGDFANATTDAEIETYIRNNADTVDHVSGTVAMGRSDCTERGCGALNPDLTVKGTFGLRVVDASAFVSHSLVHTV